MEPEKKTLTPEPAPSSNRRILIVDDNEQIHEDFKKVLSPEAKARDARLGMLRAALYGQERKAPDASFELSHALQGEDAIRQVTAAVAAGAPFAVVFMDVRMPPGMDGIQTSRALWEIDPNVQIVICTAYTDYSWNEIVDILGQDERWLVLRKPFDPIEVRQMATSMSKKWEANQQSSLRSEELSRLVTQRTDQITVMNLELQTRLERLSRAKAHIHHLSSHDTLTQLPNRRFLESCLEEVLAAPSQAGSPLGLLIVDLDHFKRINDGLGHESGDRVLIFVANTLIRAVRGGDRVEHLAGAHPPATVARFGGDEFVVVLPGVSESAQLMAIAQRLGKTLRNPVTIEGQDLRLSVSIGGALYPEHSIQALGLLRCAEAAKYQAKRLGRGRAIIYSPTLAATPSEELGLEANLADAIEQEQLVLFYQPIIDPQIMRVTGVEALVRWDHPRCGLLGPHRFLPIAERTGLIDELGLWVLRAGCEQQARWQATDLDPIKMNINVSPKQLLGAGFLESVLRTLEATGVDPRCIELELTESALVEDEAGVRATLNALVEAGLTLALDDFGTGYSSIKNLLELPIHTLKIDRSFIQGIHDRGRRYAVVSALLNLGRGLGLRVVAEGVEDPEDLAVLTGDDCVAIQGFYFSRPLPAAEVEAFIRQFNAPVARRRGVA